MYVERINFEEVNHFTDSGYVVVPALLDAEEIDLVRRVARADAALAADVTGRPDATGAVTRLALRNELGDDVYSAIARCQRVVDSCHLIMGGEVYHYHHKMSVKEARGGGAWEWHQDYGYWYDNGCLYPDLISVMIAVDRATKANGCLQVIRGSHKLGRLDHGKTGGQTGADPERVEAILQRLKRVYVELEPGDAVFFHANTLHRSDANLSDEPRWAFIACYNMARNDPYKESKHPRYSKLEVWPDERVRETALRQLESLGALAEPSPTS